jgi:hypothetical protein
MDSPVTWGQTAFVLAGVVGVIALLYFLYRILSDYGDSWKS